jgi:serine/threonine-protein kinase RsbT
VRRQQQDGEIGIGEESDIIVVRKTVREAAARLGFGLTDVTRIVTAASELARNVFLYAGSGSMRWRKLDGSAGAGIELTFQDNGPGIPDIGLSRPDSYSTGAGLGIGLPGARRLMGEMEIHSEVGRGTTVTVRKWRR